MRADASAAGQAVHHGATLGDPLPRLELAGLDGGVIDIGTFQGTRLVLFFWASW